MKSISLFVSHYHWHRGHHPSFFVSHYHMRRKKMLQVDIIGTPHNTPTTAECLHKPVLVRNVPLELFEPLKAKLLALNP
jgi:hypothetical protein